MRDLKQIKMYSVVPTRLNNEQKSSGRMCNWPVLSADIAKNIENIKYMLHWFPYIKFKSFMLKYNFKILRVNLADN